MNSPGASPLLGCPGLPESPAGGAGDASLEELPVGRPPSTALKRLLSGRRVPPEPAAGPGAEPEEGLPEAILPKGGAGIPGGAVDCWPSTGDWRADVVGEERAEPEVGREDHISNVAWEAVRVREGPLEGSRRLRALGAPEEELVEERGMAVVGRPVPFKLVLVSPLMRRAGDESAAQDVWASGIRHQLKSTLWFVS